MSPRNRQHENKKPLLRRGDQFTLAAAAFLAMVSMFAYWSYQGGLSGRFMEIEQAPSLEAEFQVNINKAQWPEIAMLPRIGEVLAKRIVESRNREGNFQSLDDLQRVSGIGPATFHRMKPYLVPIASPDVVADR